MTPDDLGPRLGIDGPLFAFSHCRDVVREVSRAGGLGVLGVNLFTPDALRRELDALERELAGRPYGVDVLYPGPPPAGGRGPRSIPAPQKDFLRGLATDAGLGPGWDAAWDDPDLAAWEVNTSRERTDELLEICLEHRPSLVVSALRPMPAPFVERMAARDIIVGGMVGSVTHARAHVRGGANLIIAQGAEAGGHTGDIATMVLVPEVVDAVAPIPVLAAGGIATGRQMAAALALGAAGVWTGSVWLAAAESDLEPEVVEKLLAAGSADTVKTRAFTGKPCRSLTDSFVAAWARPDAPETLPMPLQELLIRPFTRQAHATRRVPYMGTPVGQVVGLMRERRRAADIVATMFEECATTVADLDRRFAVG